jgi:hypothetical protein
MINVVAFSRAAAWNTALERNDIGSCSNVKVYRQRLQDDFPLDWKPQ